MSHQSINIADLESFLARLLEHSARKMIRNLTNVRQLRERGPPLEIIVTDEFDEGLGGCVDHRIGDHTGLTQSRAQRQTGEDVPVVALRGRDRLLAVDVRVLIGELGAVEPETGLVVVDPLLVDGHRVERRTGRENGAATRAALGGFGRALGATCRVGKGEDDGRRRGVVHLREDFVGEDATAGGEANQDVGLGVLDDVGELHALKGHVVLGKVAQVVEDLEERGVKSGAV